MVPVCKLSVVICVRLFVIVVVVVVMNMNNIIIIVVVVVAAVAVVVAGLPSRMTTLVNHCFCS